MPDGVNGPLYSSREASTQVVVPTSSSGLMSTEEDDRLCHQSPVDFANANRPDAWLLVQGNQATCHEGTVGCPRGVIISQPVGEVGNDLA